MTELNRETIKKRIREIAKGWGVDPDLVVKVAECESGLNPAAIHLNWDDSLDRGLYQWNSYYHPKITPECAYNIDCSTIEFCKAVRYGHLGWWSATRHCWRSIYIKSLLVKLRDLLKKLVSKYKELISKLRGF